MTALLQQAFAAAQELPESEQDLVAKWLLAEIRARAAWDDSFARSHPSLQQMADAALAEHRSGATIRLDPSRGELAAGYGAPDDEALVAAAASVFLEFDRREPE